MAKTTTQKSTKTMEEQLWDAANKLRGNVESSEYKHVVLNNYPLVDRDEVYKEIFEQAENYKKNK